MSDFKLYEIGGLLNDAISAAEEYIDHDTGLIPDDWATFLEDVQYERDYKALSIACWIKNMEAEESAIEAEEKKLRQRRLSLSKKNDSIRSWLAAWLKPGEKLSDSRAVISWRKSSSVQVLDEKLIPDMCWIVKREISKTAIKDEIKAGREVPGAAVVENQNIQIK